MMKKILMQRSTKELQKGNGKRIKRKENASKGAEKEETRR
jgi:hypothetical protein